MKTFEVTGDHLKLVKRMYFEFNDYVEFGAPAVNPKRPYGNSDVYGDIAEILDEPLVEDEWGDKYVSAEQKERFDKLHRETVTVLQIAVRTGSFETGIYVADKYMQNWRRVYNGLL